MIGLKTQLGGGADFTAEIALKELSIPRCRSP